jgi:hypothetical protein
MVQAVGPMWPGGFETIVATKSGERYEILYLPDLHNDELQREGKPPVYYWLPNAVRIARAGDTGDYKFHLIHFLGVLSADTTVGVAGTEEVAGGVLGVTVTSAPPLDVLEASHKQLTDRLRGDTRRYWSWRIPAEPQFAPVPISDSRTHMSNLSPRLDGTVPSSQPPTGGPGGVVSATPGAPAGTPGAPGAPKSTVPATRMAPRLVKGPRAIREGRDVTPHGLDAWYMRIEGDGPGSLNPAGENAYAALCGSLPAAILWAGFHGTYSPVVVSQTLNLKVWSETLRIKIRGDWDRVFSHFSAAAAGRAWWFNADIKVEFNNLRINGGITVEVEIDGTNPGADKMKEEVDKRIDLIVNKFTEQAKARIFDPAPPEVKPAEASSGGVLSSLLGGFGGGFALKYRRDETKLNLSYDETRQERFNLSTTISSSLEGFYNEIKADPAAEQKYFTNLFLEDWDRKIIHNFKPVVNWPDASRKWVGEPVAFLACQIGYPSAAGDIQWTPHVFQSTDTTQQTTWQPAFSKKALTDVSNPPPGWAPDVSYIKRSIHFTEPPSETENPYVRCFVEKNVVDLDPDPNGTATQDLNIEVRADSAGKLDVGPIGLGALLEGPSQTVEVEFKAHGRTADGHDRNVTRFQFNAGDQDKERYWTIFTGQPEFVPAYQYRVHVVVKGSIFTKGLEWWGEWVETSGNGPLMVVVPTADEAAQVRRTVPSSRPPAKIESANGAPVSTPVQATTPAGQPPANGSAGKPTTPAGKPRSLEPAGSPARRDVQGYSTTTSTPYPKATTKDAPAERTSPTPEPAELVLSDGWSHTAPRDHV